MELRMANMAIGSGSSSSSSSSSSSGTNNNSGKSQSDGAEKSSIEAARRSIHKALDCQTFIVSLFTKGMPPRAYTHTHTYKHFFSG